MIEVPPPTRISKPFDAVADPRDEADVVDADDRAVGVRGRERGLDLPRHQLRRRMADEVADVCDRVLGRVEGLVGRDSRPGIAGDVADRVAAALAARQAGRGDLADQLGSVGQRDVMHLDVLAGRDVALVERHVLLDDGRERVHLIRRDAAERQLHADHLHARLALPVDALLEAEADELVLGGLPVEELARLVVEVVELVLEDRDDVAGDVLVDLRVLARPDRPLPLLDLAHVLVEVCFGGLRLGCLRLRWRGGRLHDPFRVARGTAVPAFACCLLVPESSKS